MSDNKNSSLGERAKAAVREAYRRFGASDPSANPIFTDEMYDLLQEQDPHTRDPLCLFHYFGILGGDWYVYGAEKLGPKAIGRITGESAAGMIHFWAFACLGDSATAEAGLVPLDKAGGMGLRDIRAPFPGMAAVELDRYYSPRLLSVVWRSIKR